MEHRHDLEEVPLSGLPAPERRHVIEIINKEDASKLQELRARSDRDKNAPRSELADPVVICPI